MKKIITFLISSLILMSSNIVNAADKIVFGTNWLAQGGHGGFYQAIADGTYKKHGLDVEIMMGVNYSGTLNVRMRREMTAFRVHQRLLCHKIYHRR